MSLSKSIIYRLFIALTFLLGSTSCSLIPNVNVWLKRVDFEVDPGANRGEAFPCHIVVAYSQDLHDRLQGMGAEGYFGQTEALEKKYKDSIEIFKFDMIPGKNQLGKSVNLKSYTKAKGAFIFARIVPGKFMENIGSSPAILVTFSSNSMKVSSGVSMGVITDKFNLNSLTGKEKK